jgi:DNA-directed RNA polymerase II subunit RPB7
VIAVVKIDDIGKCEIVQARGHAICLVIYQAIVYMPFQGEVVEGIIDTVHMVGLFVKVGPVTVFVMSGTHMPNLTYDGNSNSYRGDDGDSVMLKKDDSIRLKIFKVSIEMSKIDVLGTLAGNFLQLM